MRLLRGFLIAGLGLAGVTVGAWVAARPPQVDVFYATEVPASAIPGTLLRVGPFEQAVPVGAKGWRILYVTTRSDNKPAVASAIVLAPDKVANEPRPAIAWAHGTTGIARGCAPSLSAKPFANVPALDALLAEGWAYVATDYAGLGTAGTHAYLVGDDAARSVLDAVRAARQLPGIRLDRRMVVWGHSQGGHAALWTGIRGNEYAPDVPLSGVAAFAPATDLPALMTAAQSGGFGAIVSAYLVHAYAAIYPGIDVSSTIPFRARWLAADIAGRCVGGYETLMSIAQTMLMPAGGIITRETVNGTLGARLRENTPDKPITAPVFIAQGEADDLVLPSIQRRFVTARCAAGQKIAFKLYLGLDHISLVAPGSALGSDLINWTRERLAGLPVASTCATI
jgi:alpha-beta hydrolase superfamily lysophospholipase